MSYLHTPWPLNLDVIFQGKSHPSMDYNLKKAFHSRE